MTKAFESIHAGLQEALEYAKGTADKSKYRIHVPTEIDVKEIRASMDMSQEEFASRFNLTAARVRDWEQGRSRPDSAARAYLIVIMNERKAVERALSRGTGGASPAGPMHASGPRMSAKSVKELAGSSLKGVTRAKSFSGHNLRIKSKAKLPPAVTKRGGTRKEA